MSERLHRRVFLQATAAVLTAMHAPAHHLHAATAEVNPRLLHLRLQTSKLDELRHFYTRKMGLTLSAETKTGFTVQTGSSNMEFTQAAKGVEPFYHFAWNIPENQFIEAKAWLAHRTPLLIDSITKKDEVHFAAWNAHAVYFRDPAGNIGELIARHKLTNSSTKPFSEKQLLCISEIGLVTRDAMEWSNTIQKSLQWPKSGSELSFIGDDMGYLIVAPVGRPWLPDRIQKAAIAPVEVMVDGKLTEPLRWNNSTYIVSGRRA